MTNADTKIKCDMRNLPRRSIRICVIRHLATKVKFFRGLSVEEDPCLTCPQVIEHLESFDMSNNRRGKCPVCGQKDVFLFAKGKSLFLFFNTMK